MPMEGMHGPTTAPVHTVYTADYSAEDYINVPQEDYVNYPSGSPQTHRRTQQRYEDSSARLPIDDHRTARLPIDDHRTARLPIDDHRTARLPIDDRRTARLPIDDRRTARLPIDDHRTARLPIDDHRTARLPIDDRRTARLPIDDRHTARLPIDAHHTARLPIDDHRTARLPIDDRRTARLPIDDHRTARLPIDNHHTARQKTQKLFADSRVSHQPGTHLITAQEPGKNFNLSRRSSTSSDDYGESYIDFGNSDNQHIPQLRNGGAILYPAPIREARIPHKSSENKAMNKKRQIERQLTSSSDDDDEGYVMTTDIERRRLAAYSGQHHVDIETGRFDNRSQHYENFAYEPEIDYD